MCVCKSVIVCPMMVHAIASSNVPIDLEVSFDKKVQFLTIILLDGKQQLLCVQAFCSVLGFSW